MASPTTSPQNGALSPSAVIWEAGIAVRLRREPGLIHNFLLLDEVSPACAAAAERVAADLAELLAG